MNKRLIVLSSSIFLSFTCTSFSQLINPYDVRSETVQIEPISQDSTIVPKEDISIKEIRLKQKTSSHFRFKYLEREKERRKKIRAKYQKNKLLKK
jgi:hypothetical protein